MGLFSARTIRARLTMAIAALLAMMAAGLTSALYVVASGSLEKEARQQIEQYTSQSITGLQGFVAARRSSLDVGAQNPVLLNLINNPAMVSIWGASLDSLYSDTKAREPWFAGALVFSADDVLYNFPSDIDGQQKEKNKAFLESLSKIEEGTLFPLPSGWGNLKTETLLAMAQKVRSKDGQLIPNTWFLTLLDLSAASQSLFGELKLGRLGFVSLASNTDSGWALHRAVGDKITSEQKEAAETARRWSGDIPLEPLLGENVLMMGKNLPKTRLAVVAVAALSDVRAPVVKLLTWSLAIGLICLLGGVLYATRLASRFSKPISDLSSLTQKVAHGDISVRSPITNKDEIGVLQNNFNSMTHQIQQRMDEIAFLQKFGQKVVNIHNLDVLANTLSGECRRFFSAKHCWATCSADPLSEEQILALKSVHVHTWSQDGCEIMERKLKRLTKPDWVGWFGMGIPREWQRHKADIERVVDTLVQTCELSIENIFNLISSMQSAALEVEIKNANAVQESLFTKQIPQPKGYEIGGFFAPAAQLGGDWYRVYYDEAGNKLRVYIGDVTGHGVSSALITAGAMGVVHTIESDIQSSKRELNLAEILLKLHNVILDVGRGHLLMTFCICEINISTGEMEFANAGHNPPYMLTTPTEDGVQIEAGGSASKPPKFQPLMSRGNRLGFHDSEMTFPIKKFRIDHDGLLVLYTDGLVEAFNPAHEEFGVNRLKKVIAQFSTVSPQMIVDSVIAELHAFRGVEPLRDDVSLVIIRRQKALSAQKSDAA